MLEKLCSAGMRAWLVFLDEREDTFFEIDKEKEIENKQNIPSSTLSL